jgi:hypothetical protein
MWRFFFVFTGFMGRELNIALFNILFRHVRRSDEKDLECSACCHGLLRQQWGEGKEQMVVMCVGEAHVSGFSTASLKPLLPC